MFCNSCDMLFHSNLLSHMNAKDKQQVCGCMVGLGFILCMETWCQLSLIVKINTDGTFQEPAQANFQNNPAFSF